MAILLSSSSSSFYGCYAFIYIVANEYLCTSFKHRRIYPIIFWVLFHSLHLINILYFYLFYINQLHIVIDPPWISICYKNLYPFLSKNSWFSKGYLLFYSSHLMCNSSCLMEKFISFEYRVANPQCYFVWNLYFWKFLCKSF